ncbi:MAG: PDDEXK nuclease domain-containing protein [Chloroflexota bacterium]
MNGDLLARIRQIWESAQVHTVRSVNSVHVCANWLIGQQIVVAEQDGEERADYGAQLLKNLSQQLTADYGSGFSLSALKYMRSFYRSYPKLISIGHAPRDQLGDSLAGEDESIQQALSIVLDQTSDTEWKAGQLHPGLSWTHYRTLLKVEHQTARDFYEIEAVKNGWSTRQLARQIESLLFERLLKSRDKDGLLVLANEGLTPNQPSDIIKDPYVLEFLDLPESHRLTETDLEEALLAQLQDFLLELGSGFAFVGRQVRLTLEGDHFYPDLIFYHIKLKCYVVIDLKVAKLSHADLGQMQLYVHYYDREVAEAGDNPTIGLILCTDKNDAMVRYVLDEKNQQIFASRYQFYLPSEEELRAELRRELELIDRG